MAISPTTSPGVVKSQPNLRWVCNSAGGSKSDGWWPFPALWRDVKHWAGWEQLFHHMWHRRFQHPYKSIYLYQGAHSQAFKRLDDLGKLAKDTCSEMKLLGDGAAHSLDRRQALPQPGEPIHGWATPGDHINGRYKRRGQFAIIFTSSSSTSLIPLRSVICWVNIVTLNKVLSLEFWFLVLPCDVCKSSIALATMAHFPCL